jgi:uncharacterized protein
VDAAPDELTTPLGLDRGKPARAKRLLPKGATAGWLALVVAAAALAVAATLVATRRPAAPEPFAVAPIVVREAVSRQAASKPEPQNSDERSAGELESASGVSVVRPPGDAAPESVVISVPDGMTKLAPAPDPRLVERTRYGLLPKIGADGTRPSQVYARPAAAKPGPRVAVVMGGLGIGQSATADAVAKLPAAVTLAFAPYGGDLERAVSRARDDGHEVMLQVPMEPFDYPDNDPGPHTLTVRAKPQENIERLHWVMGRFAGYTGLVTFMGAKLTADEMALAPILKEIAGRGLLLVDDGSSSRSVVRQGPTALKAQTVLDAVPRAEAIDRELQRLEDLARERGTAIGSASALPLTIDRITRWTRTLEERGIQLVPLSALAEARR